MSFLYEIAIHLLALIALPKFLYDLIFKKKYRTSFLARFGRGFPTIERDGRPLVWIHAVSVGETRASIRLIKKLKEHPSNPLILLSTTTETGLNEGVRSIPEADWHVFLPFDFSYVIKPIVKRVDPTLVILVETDFWYNFLTASKDEGASCIVVNGKISERSFKRLLKFPNFAKALFDPISKFCLQGDLYAKRFESLGIEKEKIKVTGNLKLDGAVVTSDPAPWRELLGIKEGDLVVTLGSTHDPEEKIFLALAPILLKQFPHLKILIVPRHPERFDHVWNLIEKSGLRSGRMSAGKLSGEEQIILVDGMGILRHCYQISTIAFVGGSLTEKVGGHNILEPSFYGIPVIFGPHLFGQPDLFELAKSYHSGIVVTQETLQSTLTDLLTHPEKRAALGNNGLRLTTQAAGALEKTLQEINLS